MKPDILFSVVIPSYNRASFIRKTLHSVLEQTYILFEIIVINDGSTDNTEAIVNPLLVEKRIRYYQIKNSERGAARNFGVQQSKGDYITFLDSDDMLLPWYLQEAHKRITSCDKPPAFHLGYEMKHPSGRVDSLPKLPSPVNDKLLEGNFLSCLGIFLRRDVAMENPFDEDRGLSGSEDYELWLRIAARVPILTFPEVCARLINHESRSVIITSADKLITRIDLLDQKLQHDEKFMQQFGDRLAKFSSYRTLYMALHLALSGERWLAFKSLLLTAYQYPYVVFNYRFIVALKKILLW